jgi:hypothetical protein
MPMAQLINKKKAVTLAWDAQGMPFLRRYASHLIYIYSYGKGIRALKWIAKATCMEDIRGVTLKLYKDVVILSIHRVPFSQGKSCYTSLS